MRKNFASWSVVVFSLVASSACSKEEEKIKIQPAASFFAASDLEPGTLKTSTEDDVVRDMNSRSDFYANRIGGYGLDDEEACVAKLLDALPLVADKANLKAHGTIDLAACLQSVFDGYPVRTAELQVLFYLGCEDDDLSDYDGKQLGALRRKPGKECNAKNTMHLLMDLELNFAIKGEIASGNDSALSVDLTSRMLIANETEDGAPCTVSHQASGWLWSDSCRLVSREIDDGGEDYMRLSYAGITESDNQTLPFYKSGHFDVVLNQWSGGLDYHSADESPLWIMNAAEKTTQGAVSGSALRGSPGTAIGTALARLESDLSRALTRVRLR